MMEIRRAIIVLALMIVSTVVSLFSVKYLAETVYFDKFILNKSTAFGYWPHDDRTTFASFGKRAEDIAYLDQFANKDEYPVPAQVLGDVSHKAGPFTIVVIGDSFAWGQGIRESERFSVLLERQLNAIAPTKVISLARQGDGLFDNYVKYEIAKYAYPETDLYIFGVVDNDIMLLGGENSYNEKYLQSLIQECGARPFLYAPETKEFPEDMYYQDEYSNYCVMKKIIPQLPKGNAVYFDYGSEFFGQFPTHDRRVVRELTQAGLVVMSANSELKQISEDRKSQLYVSNNDSHPGALAHSIFARIFAGYISHMPYYQ